MSTDSTSVRGIVRQLFSFERDVLVLSLSMFAFSLGFQMTGRYMGRYLDLLGASAFVIGLYGTVGNVIGFAYPYPGGAVSDRIGSRTALTLFGLLSTLGFVVWFAAGSLGFGVGAVFLGLLLVQCWQSFGLGATFAIVKQSVADERLATGFASTETVRRTAFLVGPLLASALIATYGFGLGFRYVVGVAAVVALVGTVAQHRLYDPSGDALGKSFEGIGQLVDDLRGLPPELPPLLLGDTLVRFANGMVYTFFVIVVTQFLEVDVTLPVVGYLSPDALFGVLLAVEMAVALLTMVPVAALTRRVGLKPVVALGFAVYAVFPVLLISAPADPLVVTLLFAVSGLRFAGLPAHKALIVGPAERNEGGRVTGAYYLVRNFVVIPSSALGGLIYGFSPRLAFGAASAVGLLGVVLFLAFGKDFDAAVAA
ncbi:MFS transporter [Halomarina ordinaria]|uniref:MFS transporter n=1 Tax=Halomarina ordinaria TaxID=3033939 RepID=A0ABD5U8L3_9EURY|nr:MFS transporter [Halomarina sp. PSRA2]